MLIGLLCVIAVFLIYLFASVHRLGYWRRRGIPGPQPKLFVGALNQLNDPDEPNVLRIAKWTQKYGRVFGFQKGWRNFLVISEPSLVKEVTTRFDVFHERETIPIRGNLDTEAAIHVFHARGHRWARIRSQSMKLLSTENLKKLYPTLNDAANRLCDRIRSAADSSSRTDVHPFFCSFTVETISRIVFGDKFFFEQLNNSTQQPLENVILELLNECDLPIATLSWSFPWFAAAFGQLRLLHGRQKRSGLAELIRRVDENIKRRKSERLADESSEIRFRPLLDDFLDVESDNVTIQRTNGRFAEPIRTQNSSRLTPTEINAQCCAFLIAGFGTSSSTLALICFYLARNLGIQKQMREEIRQKCADPLQPTFGEVQSLRVVDAVVKECLRLHPVGTFAFGRKSAVDVTLSDGTQIAKGTHVLIDVPSLHRDQQLWGADAEKFRPNRWLRENEDIIIEEEESLYREKTDLETNSDSGNESMSDESAETPKSVARKATAVPFYAFGGGPRMCPGYRMACLEIRLAVAKIFAEFQIQHSEEAVERPKLHGNLILLPEPVSVRFERVL